MSNGNRDIEITHAMIYTDGEVPILSMVIRGIDLEKPEEIGKFLESVREDFKFDTELTDEGVYPVLEYFLIDVKSSQPVTSIKMFFRDAILFGLFISWMEALVKSKKLFRTITFVKDNSGLVIVSHSPIQEDMIAFLSNKLKILKNLLEMAKNIAEKEGKAVVEGRGGG